MLPGPRIWTVTRAGTSDSKIALRHQPITLRGYPFGRWRSASTASLDRGHHVLDPGVVLQPVHRQVLAVTGVLEATVWHLGDQRDVRVDPDTAEVQPLRHPHRPAEVLRPHT